MHRHLYKDHTPPCIIACFSTTVLYVNSTPANKSMVFRALQHNIADLLLVMAEVSTPRDKLARAQALFLYQIIRLFDGDITLRAQGERDVPVLERWLRDLSRVRDNLGGGPDDNQQHGVGNFMLGRRGNPGPGKGCRRDMARPAEWEVSPVPGPSSGFLMIVESCLGTVSDSRAD